MTTAGKVAFGIVFVLIAIGIGSATLCPKAAPVFDSKAWQGESSQERWVSGNPRYAMREAALREVRKCGTVHDVLGVLGDADETSMRNESTGAYQLQYNLGATRRSFEFWEVKDFIVLTVRVGAKGQLTGSYIGPDDH